MGQSAQKGWHQLLRSTKATRLPTLAPSRSPLKWHRHRSQRRRLIVELVGHHPDLLRSNLTLLQTYSGENTQITTDDVEGLLANTREASVFELVDAVARKSIQSCKASQAYLHYESPIMILNLLIRHYRQLAKCQALMNSSVPDSEWARRIGIPPFGLRKIQEQARTLHPNRVLDQLIAMYDAETDLKRRSHERNSIIEHIITGLI